MATHNLAVGLIGNPNCGKTTLFNALTGAHQEVGNWPGVTVERKVGHFTADHTKIEVVDLPGLYSLDTADSNVSLDEQIARNYALSGEARAIINIVDASNLERNLFLTTQLLEMRVPVVLALNMCDVAEDRNIQIDFDKLGKKLGVPVFNITASKNKGVAELKQYLAHTDTFSVSHLMPTYPAAVNEAIAQLEPVVQALADQRKVNAQWLALKALEGDYGALSMLSAEQKETTAAVRAQVETTLDDEIDIITADARYAFIAHLLKGVLTRKDEISRTASDKIDRVVLNRILGIPIFLALMYLMFMFTINLGGVFIDFFDLLFGAIFVDGFGHLLASIGCPEWLKVFLANGIGGGIQTVATFIPPIGFLFIFLSILEDSGYMARAAFVMDRFMRVIGLPGKSFVPLIVGFGCGVPAIMGTRTLESARDRLMTIAMVPFMSCGARLPIYALFAVAFFPTGGQNMLFALYLIGIAVAILTGFALKHTLLPGQGQPFIMELPPYHLPTFKGIFLHTWERLRSFIIRAGRVIIIVVMALNILNSIGTDGSFGNEDTQTSVLSAVGRTIVPVFKPLGIQEENWPAAVGIFTGILAKEAVVGTLNALYAQPSEDEEQQAEEPFNLWAGIGAAFQSIPDKLSELKDKIFDPFDLGAVPNQANLDNEEELAALADAQEINASTFTTMQTMFGSSTAAFAYLLLILMYFPCVAAFAAVVREAGMRWAIFVGCWTTALGYCVAVLYYQSMTYAQHPNSSMAWIIGILIFFAIALFGMRTYGARNLPAKTMASTKTQGA